MWTDENKPTTESIKKRGRKVDESGTVEGKATIAIMLAIWLVGGGVLFGLVKLAVFLWA